MGGPAAAYERNPKRAIRTGRMSSPQPPAPSPRVVPIALIVAAIVCVLEPGVHGDWGRDDYFQLAFARLVGSPWPLFAHDHFPVPGSVFRPLGFASMWLGVQLFGSDYAAHAWSDVALHAAVALALFALLRRLRIAPWPAALATLAFALHPAATGPALWWSARFDLLATLFVLLALVAAVEYRDHGDRRWLAAALLAALAAMLSKEIGLVAVAAAGVLWLRQALTVTAQRRRALFACVGAALCAAVYFGWRARVLGTAASGITGTTPLGEAILAGIGTWLQQAPGYLTFWPRLDGFARGALVVLALASLPALRGTRLPGRDDVATVLCGLVLLVSPALLQAPVAALNAHPLGTGESAIEAAMQSRLYYLGIAGGAIVLATALDRAWRTRFAAYGPLLGAIAAGVLVAFGVTARRDAQAFTEGSVRNAAVAHAAVDAVDALALPTTPCHVVFLGIDPAPEWSVYVSMDSVVKALDADLARVAPCWFHANYPTWFFLMPASVDASAALPYRPLQDEGRTVPWLHVGGATIAYLDAHVAADADARARYLRWNGRGFDEVGADAAAPPAGSGPP
jgi:hypothetical protein